jgi:hypothetical protein
MDQIVKMAWQLLDKRGGVIPKFRILHFSVALTTNCRALAPDSQVGDDAVLRELDAGDVAGERLLDAICLVLSPVIWRFLPKASLWRVPG